MWGSLVTLLLSVMSVTLALDPVTVKGNAFFVGDTRFYIKGVAYQPGGSSDLSDPLSDPEICKRDITYFKELGINTIRVYSVDNTADHDECMAALADAGIYLLLDVNIPDASISRSDPECSYNGMYLEQVFATVKMFAEYDNVLGFFAANEVINTAGTSNTAPYVKAVVRDMKNFLYQRGLRQIPVGYSAADIDEIRLDTANFFNCGNDSMARVDMFGFNDYSWCGRASSFTISGYDKKVEEFGNYSIPLFFSEFGCNTQRPRLWNEVESLYSTDMSAVFSGGLAYEYSEEKNNYGLVELSGDSVELLEDFTNLAAKFNSTADPLGDGGYKQNGVYSTCPELGADWNSTNVIPDTPQYGEMMIYGEIEPQGGGYNASTQWACTMNQFLVSQASSLLLKASSRTSASSKSWVETTSAGSSSSGSSSSSSSSSKKNDAVGAFTYPTIMTVIVSALVNYFVL